jgi:hypothetical protein
MVVNQHWTPDVLVKYIMEGEFKNAKNVNERMYEIQFEYRRFTFYAFISKTQNMEPKQENMVVGGLPRFSKEFKAKLTGILWPKVLEVVLKYQLDKDAKEAKRRSLEKMGIGTQFINL